MLFVPKKWTRISNQFFAVASASLGAITDGMTYSWASPIIPMLKSPDSQIHVEDDDVLWLEMLYMIGALCSLPITVYLTNRFGRKVPLFISAVLNLVHWIALAFCTDLYLLFVLRFLTGLASTLIYVPGTMYAAEISDADVRGGFSCSFFLMQLVGILIFYAVGPFVPIPLSSSIGAIFPAMQIALLSQMPESPYYLLVQGFEQEAREALRFFRKSRDVELELQDIKAAVLRQREEQDSLEALLVVRSNRKALIISFSQAVAQSMTGMIAITMNLHTILTDANGYFKASTSSIWFSAIMLVSGIVSSVIVDGVGRKLVLAITNILTGLSLIALATYFALKEFGYNVLDYNWMPLASILLYAITYKLGLGLIPIVLSAELFPMNVKSIGMTITDGAVIVFGTISIYIHLYLTKTFATYVPLFIFAAWALLNSIFVLYYVPETKGRTLEEIQMILKGHALR